MKSKILSGLVLFLLSTVAAFAQMKVSGNIVDEFGAPLMAATVLETGPSNGTVTDFDGMFTLNVAEGKQIQVSYMGFKTVTQSATKSMVIRLVEDMETLEEVVVVGYGSQKKKEVTENGAYFPKACVITYGCQQNVSDSQRIRGMLSLMGLIIKTTAIDMFIENLNLCKFFIIVLRMC